MDFANAFVQFRTAVHGMAPTIIKAARTLGGQFSAAFVSGLMLRKVSRDIQDVVASAMSFEDSFTGVRKTVDATAEEFAILSDQIRELSKVLPISVEEINRIGEVAGQLGIKKTGLIDFTETIAKLAATTTMTSESAAFALARLASIAKLPEEEFNMLGGVIVELGNNFATTEGMMTNLAMRIVGTGRVVGMSVPDIFAMSAAISQVGVRAELGGTAMSRFLIRVANATRVGGMELNTLARVAGMTGDEFKKQFAEDSAMAVALFLKGLDRMKEEGQDVFAVLEKLGLNAVRVRDVILRSSQAAPEMFKALDLARAQEEIEDSANALEVEFQKRVETATSRVALLGNVINDLKIDLGNQLLPAIKATADAVAGFAKGYQNLSETQRFFFFAAKNVITVLTALGIAKLMLGNQVKLLTKLIMSLNVTIRGVAITAKGATIAFNILLGVLSIYLFKAAQAAGKTQEFVDAIARLRAENERLTAQEKLDLLKSVLGDNPTGTLQVLMDAGVELDNIVDILTRPTGDLALTGLIAEMIKELDVGNITGAITNLEEAEEAMMDMTGGWVASFEGLENISSERMTKIAAVMSLIEVAKQMEKTNPIIKTETAARNKLMEDGLTDLGDTVEGETAAIVTALDLFNNEIIDSLRDGFDAFSSLEADLDLSLDEFFANQIVNLERQNEFEEALKGLAEKGLAGLVNQFKDQGPKATKLIQQILAAPEEYGQLIELIINENDPKYIADSFEGGIAPVLAKIQGFLGIGGDQLGQTFASNFADGANSLFGGGDDALIAALGVDNLPNVLAATFMEQGNLSMTIDEFKSFVFKTLGSDELFGAVADVSADLAGEFTDTFAENAVAIEDVVSVISDKMSKTSAERAFNKATKDLNDLLAEQDGILGDIAIKQAEVDKLRARDAERTAQEQLRIRDATRKVDHLTQAVEEGQDATLELAVAEEELAGIIKEADEDTSELTQAERELADLRERQINLPDEIADATLRQEGAVIRLVEAEQALVDVTQGLFSVTSAQVSYFMSIAKAAGVSGAMVQSLVDKFELLPDVVDTDTDTSAGTTPPVVTTKKKTTPSVIDPSKFPKFAKGGFLPLGSLGIVGERGPELIQSTLSGTQITPLSGSVGGNRVTVNVTGFPTDSNVARNIAENIRRELNLLEEEGRGGLLSR